MPYGCFLAVPTDLFCGNYQRKVEGGNILWKLLLTFDAKPGTGSVQRMNYSPVLQNLYLHKTWRRKFADWRVNTTYIILQIRNMEHFLSATLTWIQKECYNKQIPPQITKWHWFHWMSQTFNYFQAKYCITRSYLLNAKTRTNVVLNFSS